MMETDEKTTPCTICNDPTPMLGTKLCDRCWELQRRIKAAPKIAKKILAELEEEETDDECWELQRRIKAAPKIAKKILAELEEEETDDE